MDGVVSVSANLEVPLVSEATLFFFQALECRNR